MRVGGGDCLKYLKRGWNRTEERGHKDYKKEGQVGSRCGYLKKVRAGLEPPYELWLQKRVKLATLKRSSK